MNESWVYIGYNPGQDPEVFSSFEAAFEWVQDGIARAERDDSEAIPYIFRVRSISGPAPQFEGYVLMQDDTFEWEDWASQIR